MAAELILVGNCQVDPLADCLRLMAPDLAVRPVNWADLKDGAEFAVGDGDRQALVFFHSHLRKAIKARLAGRKVQCAAIPEIYFGGFHPDAVYASHKSVRIAPSANAMNSAIALYAWTNELSPSQAAALFTPRVFERIGYCDYFAIARQFLLETARTTDFPLDDLFDGWLQHNPFMFMPKHPKLVAIADLARAIVRRGRFRTRLLYPERFLREPFADRGVWPVYPGIAENLGLVGEYAFKLKAGATKRGEVATVLSLEEFIENSYKAYEGFDPQHIKCDRFADARFRLLDDFIAELRRAPARPALRGAVNPYRGLPAHQFWRSAMGGTPREQVDPVVAPVFTIGRETKVATAGSCFAQHIARALQRSGFHYFVAEKGDDSLNAAEREARQYGLFSARFGNIYTARQLRQLIDRAYARFTPQDSAWARADGRLIDPFRPTVEPDGFADAPTLESDRAAHLAAIRHMFENLDVFVFTLGLTEAWEAIADGTVFPVAPGTVASSVDMSGYRFVNYSVEDVIADLDHVIAELSRVNPAARVILTVSPVPLVATYENRHVLVSTTYSKAVLRVAAETIANRYPQVAYFPSYEIVTGQHARGRYFEDDLRSVAPEAVDHVMGLFLKHYGSANGRSERAADPLSNQRRGSVEPNQRPSRGKEREVSAALLAEYRSSAAVICDEELLDS